MKLVGEPFWIVGQYRMDKRKTDVVGDINPDPKKHYSFSSAYQESKRLAKKFPGDAFVVFQASIVSAVNDPNVVVMKFGKAA